MDKKEFAIIEQVKKELEITKNPDFLKELNELSKKIQKRIVYSKLEDVKESYKRPDLNPLMISKIDELINKNNEEHLNKVKGFPDFNEDENKIYVNLKTYSLENVLKSILLLESANNTLELYNSLEKIDVNEKKLLTVFESLDKKVEKYYPGYRKSFEFDIDTLLESNTRKKIINNVIQKYSTKNLSNKLNNESEVEQKKNMKKDI